MKRNQEIVETIKRLFETFDVLERATDVLKRASLTMKNTAESAEIHSARYASVFETVGKAYEKVEDMIDCQRVILDEMLATYGHGPYIPRSMDSENEG